MVKDATDTTCRVELHARGQTITVDRTRIKEVTDTSTTASAAMTPGGGQLYGAGTPRATDGMTPLYTGSRTPNYGGGQTPMYGSQTPMHDGGSGRTPYYGGGGATPAYDEGGGGRTPGRSAWDPTGANTPARM